jgi:hypothetical protein
MPPKVTRIHSWKCPQCSRTFARVKQWHSCDTRNIDAHFKGKSAKLKILFSAIVKQLKKLGLLRLDAVKSSINLISRHHFAGIAVRQDYLRVGFLARRPIESPRIVHTEVLGPNRVAHRVLVREAADIDAELLHWLAEAQEMQS